MKKKICYLLLVCLLLSLISTTAYAEMFDFDVFNTGEYNVDFDDMTNKGKIYSSMTQKSLLDEIYTDNGKVQVIPNISIPEDFACRIDILWVYKSVDLCFIESLICKVGGVRYNFPSVVSSQRVEDDGSITEFTMISFGSKSYPILQAISDNPDIEVKIRLEGKNSGQDFLLTPFAKSQIKLIYDSYVEAGGMNQLPVQLSSIDNFATDVIIK